MGLLLDRIGSNPSLNFFYFIITLDTNPIGPFFIQGATFSFSFQIKISHITPMSILFKSTVQHDDKVDQLREKKKNLRI